MVKVHRSNLFAVMQHNPSWNAHHGRTWRHVLQDYRTGTYTTSFTDFNRSQDLCPVPITTLSRTVGCRLPFSFPVPPRVTPDK